MAISRFTMMRRLCSFVFLVVVCMLMIRLLEQEGRATSSIPARSSDSKTVDACNRFQSSLDQHPIRMEQQTVSCCRRNCKNIIIIFFLFLHVIVVVIVARRRRVAQPIDRSSGHAGHQDDALTQAHGHNGQHKKNQDKQDHGDRQEKLNGL